MWEHTKQILNQYKDEVVSKYKENLLTSGRKASGNLLENITAEIVDGENQIQVVLNLPEYWKYVEKDTRPHWAPIEPLFEWVKAKRILPKERIGNLPEEKQLRASAYAVRYKIHEEGTTGSHDLNNTLQELNAKYIVLITNAIKEDILGDIYLYFSDFSSVGF